MPDSKAIVRALGAFREAAQPTIFSIGMKNLSAARQNFMAICLMPHIPDQLIVGSVQYIMQCYSQLHYTQTGSEMPAMHTYTVDNKLPQFVANLLQLGFIELF